ncbi:MAG TPA: hypothetical protein VHF26_15065 [Trebonia sp.]|nr:hypothetical protein [Trebonia sp.]
MPAYWPARRALQRAAVFDSPEQRPPVRCAAAKSVATGIVAAVREDAIIVAGRDGTESLDLSPATVTWLGARTAPSALRPGDPVIIRHQAAGAGSGRRLAERIWARIGRVTGTIIAAEGEEGLVDVGRRDRVPRRVVIAAGSARAVQVRFPRLAPGYLIDVIGTRHGDHLLAVTPAAAQPTYHAGYPPAPPLVSGPLPVPISGSAVWHEPDGDEPADLVGLGYPALDPAGGIVADGHGQSCVRLPYLSLGSAIQLTNECTGRTAVVSVTGDGAMARQFCDRCVTCATSPRGRLADLTMAAFVELGGNLEQGCFNATMRLT